MKDKKCKAQSWREANLSQLSIYQFTIHHLKLTSCCYEINILRFLQVACQVNYGCQYH